MTRYALPSLYSPSKTVGDCARSGGQLERGSDEPLVVGEIRPNVEIKEFNAE